jgi:hypothetical protein
LGTKDSFHCATCFDPVGHLWGEQILSVKITEYVKELITVAIRRFGPSTVAQTLQKQSCVHQFS